jgi:hypothetical protein
MVVGLKIDDCTYYGYASCRRNIKRDQTLQMYSMGQKSENHNTQTMHLSAAQPILHLNKKLYNNIYCRNHIRIGRFSILFWNKELL